MTRIVLDASVLMASLIADGPTRGILLGYHDLEFYAPEVVSSEIQKHLQTIAKRTGKPKEIVSTFLKDILSNVEVVPTEIFAGNLESARKRTQAAHAENDEAYVALADYLDAPVWTYDKDFQRVSGIRVLVTSDIQGLIEAKRYRS